MKRQVSPPQIVPLPLKTFRPVAKVMNFIEQQNRRSVLSPCFGISPTTLPETRKGCIGLVHRGVDSRTAELRGKVKEQGGLADLPGSRQNLNPSRRWLFEPFEEPIPAHGVVSA